MLDIEQLLTERDRLVFAGAGYGREIKLGERPALLVVDVTYEFTGASREPILDAIQKTCTACGEEAWEAIGEIKKLLDVARTCHVPVIYTCADRSVEAGPFLKKNKRLTENDLALAQIVEDIKPEKGEAVIKKLAPSAFFGTNLLYFLINRGIDTVIVTGGVTSGCVRATAVDAFSYGYKVVVAKDGVFDRSEVSNAVNLFDLQAKYANLQSTEEIIKYFKLCQI